MHTADAAVVGATVNFPLGVLKLAHFHREQTQRLARAVFRRRARTRVSSAILTTCN